MKLHFALFLLLLVSFNICSAQVSPGARQVALSHSDVALADDVFSIFHNPAGLARLNWREVGIYYSPAPFGLKELANGYVAYNEPTSIGSFGVGVMTYGFDLYRESKVGLAYSTNITDEFYLGAVVNYQSVSIKNYGSSGTLTFDCGGLLWLQSNLRLGFAIQNITRGTYGDEKNQIPVVFSSGISYDYNNQLSLNAAFIKELDFPASLRFGIEYNVIEYIDLRLGLCDNPNSFSSGIGINYSFVQLDYALFTHQDLGLTHQVGIIIQFAKDNNQ